MDNSAELATDIVVQLLFALPAVYFFVRGFTAGQRSVRLANLSVAIGLLVFVRPEKVLAGFAPPNQYIQLLVSGSIRTLFGCVGVLLAILAFRARSDGGVTSGRLASGGFLNLFLLTVGVGTLNFGFQLRPGNEWTFRPPNGTFSLQLPSEKWKQVSVPDQPGRIAFVNQLPFMQATVLRVDNHQTEADFLKDADDVSTVLEKTASRSGRPKWQKGKNSHGNTYQFGTLVETPPSADRIFVAHSTTWCPQKQLVIEVILECPITAKSEMAQSAILEAAQTAAEKICLSIE